MISTEHVLFLLMSTLSVGALRLPSQIIDPFTRYEVSPSQMNFAEESQRNLLSQTSSEAQWQSGYCGYVYFTTANEVPSYPSHGKDPNEGTVEGAFLFMDNQQTSLEALETECYNKCLQNQGAKCCMIVQTSNSISLAVVGNRRKCVWVNYLNEDGSFSSSLAPQMAQMGVTLRATTMPSTDNSGGQGDPHMTNAYGERFDIVREGLADLLIIRNGKDVLLKIQAMIKRTLPLCNGKFTCNFGLFMTEITLSGRWVKKEFRLGIEKAQNKEEPSVLVDGTEVWPLSAEDSIFSELNMKVSNFSAVDQGLHFDFMKATLDVRRVIENYAACKEDDKRKVKFFNVHFQGTKKLISEGMTVGGILGKDPRHDWEKCDISDEFDMVNNWERGMKFGFAKVE